MTDPAPAQSPIENQFERVYARSREDPFMEVIDNFNEPFILTSGLYDDFSGKTLFNCEKTRYKAFKEKREGDISVYLRSYEINYSKPEHHGHLWPKETCVTVNRKRIDIVQREQDDSKYKGQCEPLDILPYMKPGENEICIISEDSTPHYMVIQALKKRGIPELIEEVERNDSLTLEDSLERVKKSFCSDDNELETTSTRLSLRCPISLGPISIPARGRKCIHLQCFDLTAYLLLKKSSRASKWQCGICNLEFKLTDIEIDKYFHSAIKQLGEHARNTVEIEIFSDGSWKVPEKEKFKREAKPIKCSKKAITPQVQVAVKNEPCNSNSERNLISIKQEKSSAYESQDNANGWIKNSIKNSINHVKNKECSTWKRSSSHNISKQNNQIHQQSHGNNQQPNRKFFCPYRRIPRPVKDTFVPQSQLYFSHEPQYPPRHQDRHPYHQNPIKFPALQKFYRPNHEIMPQYHNSISKDNVDLLHQHSMPHAQEIGVIYNESNLPQQSNRLPQQRNHLPQQGSHLPQHRGYLPRQGGQLPRQSNRLPQQRNHLPQQGSHLPQHRGSLPRYQGSLPQGHQGQIRHPHRLNPHCIVWMRPQSKPKESGNEGYLSHKRCREEYEHTNSNAFGNQDCNQIDTSRPMWGGIDFRNKPCTTNLGEWNDCREANWVPNRSNSTIAGGFDTGNNPGSTWEPVAKIRCRERLPYTQSLYN